MHREHSEDSEGTIAEGPPLGPPMWAAPRDFNTVEWRRYVIEGELARGGLGRILEAHDVELDRPVAIKVLIASTPTSRARFYREALVTARLQHPSVVPVYEAGRWPSGEPFYAMKLISGRTLRCLIDERSTLAERLGLLSNVIAVADTIAYAHSLSIIHRDIKPMNVLVGQFGETLVVDWGMAKDLTAREEGEAVDGRYDAAVQDLTAAGTIIGTLAYMPPEQARGDAVDERADIYALGALLYHVLASAPPYRASGDILARILAGPPEPLEEVEPGVPRDLVAVVRKAMAREPSERYPTARELANDLRRFESGQIVSAHVYSSPALLHRWLCRRRVPAAVVAVLLVLLVLLAFEIRSR
jgi:eukaryotic-like serine/threonine-protein kinase